MLFFLIEIFFLFSSKTFWLDFSDLSVIILALLLVISIYGLYGLVDDLVDINRKTKFVVPVLFSIPLIEIIFPQNFSIPFYGELDLQTFIWENITYGDLFKITVTPVYVMVVANLVNMHSGYNGLQSGLSLILLFTLLIKSWQDDNFSKITPAFALCGSMLAFWFYNRYPSSVFEGNIGSMLMGSTIGCVIVIQQLWWFGFVILIPHTINFLLWIK